MPLTIYTGGAKGVDTHVERLSHLYGHSCEVFIPPCHPRAKSLAPLTQPDLDAATPAVTQVAFRLGRHVSHPITLQYIQRNYYVIKPASLVLALGCFDELRKHVLGGTGWSVAMAQILGKPLYVFDLDMEQWYWWNPTLQQYQPCEGMTEEQITLPPPPSKTKPPLWAPVKRTRQCIPPWTLYLNAHKHQKDTGIEQGTCLIIIV